MPIDFSQLQQAMGANTQAQADFQATEDPYAYAQQLRGGANIQPDAYGQVSPLQIIGDMIGQSTGRRDVRNLEEERKGLSQTMAASEAMKQQYELEGIEEARVLKQSAEVRAEAKEGREAAKVNDRDETPRTFVGNTGPVGTDGKRATVEVMGLFDPMAKEGKGGWVTEDAQGNTVEINMSEMREKESAASSNRKGSKAMPSSTLKEFRNKASRIGSLNRTIDTFDPSYIQSDYGGKAVKTGVINKIMDKFAKNDLVDVIDSEEFKELDVQLQKSMLWWGELMQGYSLQERHDLFGATLTNNEFKSWEQAFAVMRGMDPETAKARLGMASSRANRILANDINVTRANYQDIPGNVAAMDLLAEQVGFEKAGEDDLWQWTGLSEFESQYIDKFGNLVTQTQEGGSTPPEGGAGVGTDPTQYDIFKQGMSSEDQAKFDQLSDSNKQIYMTQQGML
tara:strand:+ start:5293 stop:6651 length:1359 start_codon:yes stop_codon:yes gene_type:complete